MHLPMRGLLTSLAFQALQPVGAKTTLLRVGMFWQSALPWFKRDPLTGEYYAGFLVDFYKEMATVGQFEIQYVPITDPEFLNNFTGVTQRLLREGVIDVGWTADSILTPGFSYTTGMYMGEQAIITKRSISESDDSSQMFAPFKAELWVSIIVAMCVGASSLSFLSKAYSDQSPKECVKRYPNYLYHTWAALLGGDEYDLYHCPPLGRLYRLGLLFFVLVTTATYTANLAAFLTRPKFVIHGPKSMDEMRTASACLRWPAAVQELTPYFGKLVLPPDSMSASDRMGWAHDMLQKNGCDCIVDSQGSLKPEALQRCDTTYLNPDISFSLSPVYNILAGHQGHLARRMSEAILKTRSRPAYINMVAQNMRQGASCPSRQVSEETTQISVMQMAPVFGVFAWCCLLSFLLTLGQRLCNHGKPIAEAKHEVKNEGLDVKLDVVLEELRSLGGALQPKGIKL